MRKLMPTAVFMAAMFFCSGTAQSLAEGGGAKAKADKPPIVVTAGSLMADNKKKLVVYQKNVVVKRGDVTLYAELVTVRLLPSDKAPASGPAKEPLMAAGKVDTIEAEGGVRIIQQDKTATSDKAVYYNREDKIVLTGQPRVWQGGNVITGTKITYNIKEDTFMVDEAKTILYQEDKTP